MKKPDPIEPGDILLEAHNIINGPRRDAYGDARQSFKDIASVWSTQLNQKLTMPITPREVAMMMVTFKALRDRNPKRDNTRDICGYASLAEYVEPAPATEKLQ